MLIPSWERIEKCVSDVRKKTDFVPELALVLGSGLGDFAESAEAVAVVNYSEIDGFPVSTVPGHKGRFFFGYVEGVKCVIMQGRVHYYEGYTMEEVVLPVRLMNALGAETLFLTNAAGGISPTFSAGDFMLINGHISSFVPSPLIGKNIDRLGVRFPDMSEVYDKNLREIIKQSASEQNIALKEGVYVQLTGPNFETPQEIKMLSMLGADAVGMSTVCEAVAAKHAGMSVCGISCISNLAAGISKTPLSHAEVSETADRVAPDFKRLISASVKKMKK
ncbi:MAG: purine-nucleoside phosphorylase [Clostridiales bacterium]|nr:purine-nucleoside phosphorylase [Clostridiales bacterium]